MNINEEFFKYFFKREKFIKKLDSMIYGIRDGKSISFKDFSSFKINFPLLSEQQKIGTFFSKLDRQIELEEKKLALLEEQKKGYMQKIFSQELRFKDENGNDYPEWEEKKLGEVVKLLKGNNQDTDLPVMTISAKRGWLNQEERFSQVIAGNSLKKYTELRRGDLSYNKGNSKVAKYGIVYKLPIEKALVPNVYKSFRALDNVDENYLEKYFHSKILDKQLRTKITSTARMDGLLNISDNEFFNIILKLPFLNEQRKIGTFFEKLDQQIELEEKKLELLEDQKKSFLQKMYI